MKHDGRGGLAVRRSRACSSTPRSTTGTPARTRRASTPANPCSRVHVPRRHRLQPVVAQPHEVPEGGRRVRHRGLQGGLPDHDHGAGDPGRQRELPDAGHRPEQPRLPAARPRLREPRRAAHGPRPALRLRRGPRLRGGDHRAHARRGLRPERARGRGHGPVRGLRQERRADAAGDRQAPPARAHDRLDARAARSCCESALDGLGRGLRARRPARLPQQPGHGARAHRHHRLHDGLRHHRHRARHRARQVQEARGRRDDEDRQPVGAGRAEEARLRRRPRSRTS